MFQIIFFVLFLILSHCNAQSNFFIPEPDASTKKKSKTDLKENIGDELKNALYISVALSSNLGAMQKEISILQETLLSNVESLIDNERKFKKANKDELANACKLMTKVGNELRNQKKTIEEILKIMNGGGCLRCERIHEKNIHSGRGALRR